MLPARKDVGGLGHSKESLSHARALEAIREVQASLARHARNGGAVGTGAAPTTTAAASSRAAAAGPPSVTSAAPSPALDAIARGGS
jgi:hypothetical protein